MLALAPFLVLQMIPPHEGWQQIAGAGAGVRELGQRLEPDTLALIYFELHCWAAVSQPSHVCSGDDVRVQVGLVRANAPVEVIDLGATERIEGAARRWRAALGRPLGRVSAPSLVEPDRVSIGIELRELALDAALARAGGASRLLVFPEDGLAQVPLDALPYGDGLVGDRWTVEHFGWLSDRPPRELDPSFLVTCDIDYGDGGPDPRSWQPISTDGRTLRESAAHFRMLHGSIPTILERGAATKSQFLSAVAHARYAHLSTHGWFDGSGPAWPSAFSARGIRALSLCGIAFAGINAGPSANGDHPGVLTGAELVDAELAGCELLVLATDGSADAHHRDDNERATLANAAHRAGAKCVIASLWDVDRRVSPQLFTHFYDELWRGHEPPARALWKAKRAVAADGAPFASWAGWTLSTALR